MDFYKTIAPKKAVNVLESTFTAFFDVTNFPFN